MTHFTESFISRKSEESISYSSESSQNQICQDCFNGYCQKVNHKLTDPSSNISPSNNFLQVENIHSESKDLSLSGSLYDAVQTRRYRKMKNRKKKQHKNKHHYYNNTKYFGQLLTRNPSVSQNPLCQKMSAPTRCRQDLMNCLQCLTMRKHICKILMSEGMKRQIQLSRSKLKTKQANIVEWNYIKALFAKQVAKSM